MKNLIIGKKIGMTQFMTDDGELIPVSVIKSEQAQILKIISKDLFTRVILAHSVAKEKSLNKPFKGQFKKYNVEFKKFIKEFDFDSNFSLTEKDLLSIQSFTKGDLINVRAKSTGKGFAGTIKRHNFSRGPMTHGSKNHRLPGSIGGGTCPGRVFKGTKMGGRMGNRFLTIKNLKIVFVDKEKNLLFIKGAIPGKVNNLIEVYN